MCVVCTIRFSRSIGLSTLQQPKMSSDTFSTGMVHAGRSTRGDKLAAGVRMIFELEYTNKQKYFPCYEKQGLKDKK